MSISAISPYRQGFGNTTIKAENKPKDKTPVYVEEILPPKKRGIILAASVAGTAAALALCAKAQKINLLKLKEWKNFDIGMKEIFGLAAGSMVGGLSAGLIIDKDNRKDKLRESLQQMIGNIAFPITFVSAANALYKKFGGGLRKPTSNNKFVNILTTTLPAVAVTMGGLIAGIIVGNKVANGINNKIFKANEDRDVKVTDFAAHVDDTLLGASLVAKNLSTASSANLVGAAASRLIPPALVVPGYMTGIATGNPPEDPNDKDSMFSFLQS